MFLSRFQLSTEHLIHIRKLMETEERNIPKNLRKQYSEFPQGWK